MDVALRTSQRVRVAAQGEVLMLVAGIGMRRVPTSLPVESLLITSSGQYRSLENRSKLSHHQMRTTSSASWSQHCSRLARRERPICPDLVLEKAGL
jgi:hypothetical protein